MKTTIALSLALLATSFGTDFDPKKVDFVRDVKPILEGACVQCHGPDEDEGGVRLDTKKAAFEANGDNPGVVPGDPSGSSVYWTTTIDPDDDEEGDLAMPPKKSGALSKTQIDVLKTWIEQGADWPDGVVLTEQSRVKFASVEMLLLRGGPFSALERQTLRLWTAQGAVWPEGYSIAGSGGPKDDLDLVKVIHEKIVADSPEQSESQMKEYTATIPKTGAKFTMLPIPGGEFLMGSPKTEPSHFPEEGPQKKVKLEPFWMGKCEVTWDEYDPFMATKDGGRRKDGSLPNLPADASPADITSKPTSPYVEMSFSMGVHGYPAISMTQHAALKYCQWLSAQTGHFYRLPTEAEWEYACRAGTTTAYSWGDDPKKIGEYAWYADNANDKYQKVGEKKPNPWGLHDMHGNVLEWVLDKFDEKFYASLDGDPVLAPYNKPGKALYPRVSRGGSWYDGPEYCRSAMRFPSHGDWKQEDPQLPKSIWYHTDAVWLGFRIVRPLKTPSPEEMHEIWNSGRGEEF